MKKIALLLAVAVVLAGVSFAAPKSITFPGKTLAPVTFDHAAHLAVKGTVCKTCHPAIFKQMKAGKNKVTIADINKGKFCGVCHKEKGKAFTVKGNCNKCHVKAEGETEEDS